MAKRIITINRMFGSNGRLIGKTLAENLDIGFSQITISPSTPWQR